MSRGEPIQILKVEKEAYILQEEALKNIMMQKNIQNMEVAIVSIAGAFRKGKSFLLNFLIRYLGHISNNRQGSWPGDDDSPLEGFSWSGGSEKVTAGMWMWSEPFVCNRTPGEEVAVLVVDTQGVFDCESTNADWATIFAFSTLISSIQVYNISQNIQENDLQALQMFTEYGRFALNDYDTVKPFQRMEFLIRDWCFPYEYEYGKEGGKRFLEKRLCISETQNEDARKLRNDIKLSFESVGCFLLPFPGEKVAINQHFKGQWRDISETFREQLCSLMPYLLGPDNLTPKKINGERQCCKGMFNWFKIYHEALQKGDIPKPQSIYNATAQATHQIALDKALLLYQKQMKEVICGIRMRSIREDQLKSTHEKRREDSIRTFAEAKKLGEHEYGNEYQRRLENQIESAYENFRKLNESKKENEDWAFRGKVVGFIGAAALAFFAKK